MKRNLLVLASLVALVAALFAFLPRSSGGVVIMGQGGNTFLVGQQPLTVVWDPAPCEGCTVQFYEAWTDSNTPVNVGTNLRWTMPVLPVGQHSASVRACNTEATSGAVQCGPTASVSFTLVNPTPLPGAPGSPRIIPPDRVLNQQEVRLLADAFSYVHRLRTLNGNELNYLQSRYNGPVPVTYKSELVFLNATLLQILGFPRG